MAGELPEALAGIAADKRVLVRRGGEPRADGKCVVYWVQRAQRALRFAAKAKANAVILRLHPTADGRRPWPFRREPSAAAEKRPVRSNSGQPAR